MKVEKGQEREEEKRKEPQAVQAEVGWNQERERGRVDLGRMDNSCCGYHRKQFFPQIVCSLILSFIQPSINSGSVG